jgi:hypothetical protein
MRAKTAAGAFSRGSYRPTESLDEVDDIPQMEYMVG